MASVAGGLAKTAFELAFTRSPIMLTGGIARNIPGKTLPLGLLLQAGQAVSGLASALAGGSLSKALDAPVVFEPLAGSNLISNQVASYPFASQAVAGISQIVAPTTVAIRMVAPAKGQGGYALKTALFLALKTTLDSHLAAGGLFTVMTPAGVYTGCVLQDLRDSTGGESGHQKQVDWTWQFVKTLVNEDQLSQVLSNLATKLDQELPTGVDNAWSSVKTAMGTSLDSLTQGLNSVENGLSNLGTKTTSMLGF
ncbi:hypothetical protein [Paraburkholderia caribensis]|uniref:hypothetical protein n=1 Tax=Paraburkholderia caribensis TaxID=75105 RepID=UPI002090318A|nr:hypothetical protein [Paraburkholderia caribensis]MCO4880234.1 hypothetical protein [Paraburkholderia caribensis]